MNKECNKSKLDCFGGFLFELLLPIVSLFSAALCTLFVTFLFSISLAQGDNNCRSIEGMDDNEIEELIVEFAFTFASVLMNPAQQAPVDKCWSSGLN